MVERVAVTISLRPEEYRLMVVRADKAGMPLRRLIEQSIARACGAKVAAPLTMQVQAIVGLHGQGLNDRQIAQRLGMRQTTVYYHRHERLRLPKNDTRGRKSRSEEQARV